MDMLKSVHIEGFKSIRDATIDLGPLTVLIGANGSGKSNFVSFFRMMQAMAAGEVQVFVGKAGGAGDVLHYGPDSTSAINGSLSVDSGGVAHTYSFRLAYAGADSLMTVRESLGGHEFEQRHMGDRDPGGPVVSPLFLRSLSERDEAGAILYEMIKGLQTLHVHNTAQMAPSRRSQYVEDNRRLHHDASNIAAYLYMLRETQRPYYDRIVGAFRLAAPWFGDFVLEPRELDPTRILLNWREKGRDTLFGPHQLSDGSLRTIALLTLLLQPEDRLPSLIIIDEPELGLHPYVITAPVCYYVGG